MPTLFLTVGHTKTDLAQASSFDWPNFSCRLRLAYQHPKFQAWLKVHGVNQFMSRKDNSLDGGVMEGLFGIPNGKCSTALKPNFRI
ncbi:hypothetical protein [uncultured Lactobacillus sp.]|uniref:hypothetical protein n=1 Tax=uncultured Lactobacillus sp. TaxID=153152 RepID=UPI0025EEF5CB|nr:hypothetical protein [uncultured Lactobacillus sp.]